MNKYLWSIGTLVIACGLASTAKAERSPATIASSANFTVVNPADASNLVYDGYSAYNASTTNSIVVQAGVGLQNINANTSGTAKVSIDNGVDGWTTTCSVYGHSTLQNVLVSGTASTNLHGMQELVIHVNYSISGSSGDPTFFVVQCVLPKSSRSLHKVIGAYLYNDF
jgi:hypothetical protein